MMLAGRWPSRLMLSVAVAFTAAPHAALAADYDVVIAHGQIVDGTGAPAVTRDVGVRHGYIVAIGDLSRASADQRIDATGLVVAPGFINVHDHSEANALPTALNMLTQGVTTAILNPDGFGPVDLRQELGTLEAGGLALNIGAYIGFNSVWTDVVGQDDRRPTAAQTKRMRDLVETGLEAGAFGVSAGLDYKPAYYARADEVAAVVSVAAPWRTIFPNHDRLTPETNWSSLAGVGETISIAERAGLSPEVTHAKAQGHEQGAAPRIIAMMRQATLAGHYASGDVYPYVAGMTALWALAVPGWAQEGGLDVMLGRFKDPEQRQRILPETERALKARFGGAAGVYLLESGRQLADVARDAHVSDAEALLRVIEGGERVGIFRFGAEQDVRAFIHDPVFAISCDCGATIDPHTHPRSYGTFPKVLGHYVRDEKLISLPEAVRKMTGLPATMIGLVDRGFLMPGMRADITVFDPANIADHSTYQQPTVPSTGVKAVVVNGVIELSEGRPTGARGGTALFRQADMPTRPMAVQAPVHLVLRDVTLRSADGGTMTLRGTLTRARGSALNGSLFLGKAGRSRPSIVQSADRWTSLTGMDGAIPYTLVIDKAFPSAPGQTHLRLDYGGHLYAGTRSTECCTFGPGKIARSAKASR